MGSNPIECELINVVYSKFISFSKKDEMHMTDYILEYEHLYHKMMEHEMKLPDAVLTFKLLDGANITDDERKLALTVCNDLNFDRMKSALKRLFSKAPLNPSNENFKNKQEEAYYNKKHKDFKHPKSNEKFKQFGKLNPVDKNGKISNIKKSFTIFRIEH